MKTKKFIGKSYQNAIEKAKDELGEEIIIIDTQEVTSGGFLSEEKKMIEIMVSLSDSDDGEEDERELPSVFPTGKPTINEAPKRVNKNLQYTYLSNELEKLNDYVEKLMFNDFPTILINFKNYLVKTGVTESDALKLIAAVQKRLKGIPVLSNGLLMGSLESVAQFYLKDRKLLRDNKQKIIALVGPPGAGKTMTLMKLATNKQIIGNRSVAIVSTDCYRMAATETLAKFHKLTSIPVYEVQNAEDFSNKIAKLNKTDLILIDTPGNNIQEKKYFSELDTYFQNVPNIKKLLVLPSTYDQRIIEKYIFEYQSLNITGMIITKIDELNFPGKILSIAMCSNLPIFLMGNGQSIPGDLIENRDAVLWNLLEERMKELIND